jgi:capsular exopolysaccharide synthesis family protein
MTYVRVLRRWLLLIVALPVGASVAVFAVSLVLPSVYEAQAVLLVRPAQVLPSTDPTTSISSDTVLQTYAVLVTDRSILEGVISDLGLNVNEADLKKRINVTLVPNSQILDVTVQDTNPARARDIANRLVDDFVARVNAIQQGNKTTTPDNLYVFSNAVLPDKPVSPNIPLNVAIGFAAGLLVALGLAFVLDYLDQSIKSDDELTARLGLIPIGHIAFALAGKGKRAELVALDGKSNATEAYKALRTNLLFSTINHELKTIVVTSSGPGEGKSRTAANLAVVLAQAGQRTLLIDADFRRPSLHKIFGRIRNVGLSNLAVQDVAENAAIVAVEDVPNLWLVTSGPIPPNPSELLSSGRIKELLTRFKNDFEYVILDTPPVNAVTDGAILAASADGTIVVVEQGRTTFPGLRHAKQLLDRVGAHGVGVVMNKVRASRGSYSYAYGYGNYGTPPASGLQLSEANGSPHQDPAEKTDSTDQPDRAGLEEKSPKKWGA